MRKHGNERMMAGTRLAMVNAPRPATFVFAVKSRTGSRKVVISDNVRSKDDALQIVRKLKHLHRTGQGDAPKIMERVPKPASTGKHNGTAGHASGGVCLLGLKQDMSMNERERIRDILRSSGRYRGPTKELGNGALSVLKVFGR